MLTNAGFRGALVTRRTTAETDNVISQGQQHESVEGSTMQMRWQYNADAVLPCLMILIHTKTS